MLINFSIKNVSSFKHPQNLSLEKSSLKKDDFLPENLIKLGNQEEILKSALIYGANASGKTNLIKAAIWFKNMVLGAIQDKNAIKQIMPFILDVVNVQQPSVFEIVFLENDIKYRYGLAVLDEKIVEEWLYYTQHRETLLFYRQKQEVEYNQSSFKEAKDFIQSANSSNKGTIEKTAPYVPFVSVLAAFQGQHSQNVIQFFEKIQSISGINDEHLGGYTFNLIKENNDFSQWVKGILRDFNIADLIVKEENITPAIELPLNEKGDKIMLGGVAGFNVRVKKYLNHSEEKVEIPLELESSGTRKIIHLLGPIYDTFQKGNVLFIDEFDSKFHTLLSKHILKLFHQNCIKSQLIANVQDTNLMDTELLRRDQIYFVHKDTGEQDSQIYSLAEYKTAIEKSYSTDYLNGAFDAIPLFSSIEDINKLMETSNGEK